MFSQVRWFKVALQLTLYYTDWFYISAPPACNVQHLHLVRPSYTRIDTFTQVWYVQLYIGSPLNLDIRPNYTPYDHKFPILQNIYVFCQVFGPKRYLLTPVW